MRQDTNIIGIIKGTDRYVFLFTDERCEEMHETLYRFARNPELSFTMYDASVLGERVCAREQLIQLTNRLPLEDEFGQW